MLLGWEARLGSGAGQALLRRRGPELRRAPPGSGREAGPAGRGLKRRRGPEAPRASPGGGWRRGLRGGV